MTALSAGRIQKRRGDGVVPTLLTLPVKAGAKIYPGALVVLNGGYAAPGSTATGLIAVGICDSESVVDNTSGANGDLTVDVRPGVYKMVNSSAGDLIAQANVGADCYIVDDQTVALTNGSSSRSRAGKVVDIDSDGSPYVLLSIGL